MRVDKSGVFALVAFTLAGLPVEAQDAKTVEVTPYVALGSAGVSPVGAAVTFPVTSTLRRGISSCRGPHPRAEYKQQSLVVSAARRPLGTVCRRGSGAVAVRRARVFLRRSPHRYPVARGDDAQRWRRPEDACK